MTNTIHNVPRELLERAATSIEQRMCIQCEGVPCCMPESLNTLSDIRALLSAPSPAGVDGLEVATFLHTMHMEIGQTRQVCSEWKGDPFGVSGVDYSSAYSVTSEPLCRLSDAQAIIDGLRGEVGAQRVKTCTALKERNDAREERDQQAQRIGELEGLLREVHGWIDESARVYRHNSTSVMLYRIDAALSAGKEGSDG